MALDRHHAPHATHRTAQAPHDEHNEAPDLTFKPLLCAAAECPPPGERLQCAGLLLARGARVDIRHAQQNLLRAVEAGESALDRCNIVGGGGRGGWGR